jgi:predicted secreted protein
MSGRPAWAGEEQVMGAVRVAIVMGLVLAGATARAGDTSKLEVVGFSPDGKLAAIVESTELDGSGLPWARAAVIDVAKNDFVGKVAVIAPQGDGSSLAKVVADARAAIAPATRKLGFDAWQPAVAATVSDKGEVSAGKDVVGTLELVTRGQKGRAPKACSYSGASPSLARLTLIVGAKRLVLNDDKLVPTSRGCPMTYSIGGVWMAGSALLVDLRYTRPGFEGPDTRSIPVTARLPAKR